MGEGVRMRFEIRRSANGPGHLSAAGGSERWQVPWGRLVRVALMAVTFGASLGACAPGPARDQPDLNVDNGTTLPVTVIVNGAVVATVAPDTHEKLAGNTLPALPWIVDATSPTGRVLLHLDVPVGSVWSTTNPDGSFEQHGAGDRVDLSCGRLDVYAGPGLAGPMPGPGVPGDCEP
jgi:hypothetical protein